ncbi:MAG: RDD family protein [Actinomycetota bacterium]
MSRADRAITPEAVVVTVDVAGLGSRMIAWLLDSLIQAAIVIPVIIGFALADLAGTVEVVVLSLLLFFIIWGYYPLFEWLWRGRTPGKRVQGLRVVRTDGQPAGGAAILVRNLIRIVDVVAFPFLAVIAMLVTHRAQRLGDLAAGTMVVREHRGLAPQPVELPERADLPPVDSTGLSEREYDLIRSFLARRHSLDRSARDALAARLATSVRERVGAVPPSLDDESLLEAAARSYRQRFGGGAPERTTS